MLSEPACAEVNPERLCARARFRALFCFSLIFLLFGALVVRLFKIQILNHAEYYKKAERQVKRLRPVKVTRGSIFDINGVLLAASYPDLKAQCSVALNLELLRKIGRKDNVSGQSLALRTYLEIATLLELGKESINEDLNRIRAIEKSGKEVYWFPVYYRRNDSGSRSYRIPGRFTSQLISYRQLFGMIRPPAWKKAVMIEVHPRRHYVFRERRSESWLYKNLCREVVGTVDAFGDGLTGAEKAFDSLLRGEAGWFEERRGLLGGALAYAREDGPGVGALEPLDVFLTLDVRLQQIAYEVLSQEIPNLGAEKGTVIILDPFSGAIRAMATFPPQRTPAALFEYFEPGSIFKCFVAAEALLQKKVSVPGPVLWKGGGRRYIPGRRKPVEDAHPGQNLTFEDGFIRSSNIIFSIVAEKLGSRGMRRLLKRFAFDRPADLSFRMWPRQAAEAFRPWRPKAGPIPRQDVISMGWGNAVMTSCVSLARAYSSLVNGGYLVEPHLLAGVGGAKRTFIPVPAPSPRRIIWNDRVLKTMKKLLREVVEDEHGTGHRLHIEGLCFGGKTGTAKRYKREGGGYAHRRWYTGGFIAHAPADKPKFVIMARVEVDRQKLFQSHLYYGSWTAGPIVRKILLSLLRQVTL